MIRYFRIRIRVRGIAPRSRSANATREQTQKISFHFLRLPPDPPPLGERRRKKIFGLRRRFSFQKLRKVIIFPNSAFSSFAPSRGARVYRAGDNSNARSHSTHFAQVAHIRSRDLLSVYCVRFLASLESITTFREATNYLSCHCWF